MIALPEDAVWSLGLGELFGGLYVFGDGSVREVPAKLLAIVVRYSYSLEPRSTGEFRVEIPTPPRGGSKLDGEWLGTQGFEAILHRVVRATRCHNRKLVTTDAESSVPIRLILDAGERGEGMPGPCYFAGGDREPRDASGAVGMTDGWSARDTQRAWSFVFDQERQHPSILPHAGTLPTYLRPIREPPSARVRTIYVKARLIQTPYIGREIAGGHTVIYEPAAGLGERPPAPHVVSLVGGIHESDDLSR